MAIDSSPWSHREAPASDLELVKLQPDLLNALAHGEEEIAKILSPNRLTPYLISDCQPVWERRRKQIVNNPDDRPWVTRLLVHKPSGNAVGRAGFHGAPDERGMVEIGYAIDPSYRRRGYARAANNILLEAAAKCQEVKVVRATVQPSNVASTNLILSFGFEKVGEQWDDEDGLETIFERPSEAKQESGRTSTAT